MNVVVLSPAAGSGRVTRTALRSRRSTTTGFRSRGPRPLPGEPAAERRAHLAPRMVDHRQ